MILSIIIPVYNEEKTVIQVLEKIKAYKIVTLLDLEAKKLKNFNNDKKKYAIIIGNEGNGVREEVLEKADEKIYIEINEKDLRIDTYKSSGAGGQHVNTTDSAVRITHTPTSIVVQCQNERSQHKNKETCMNMLRARLYNYELKKREDKTKNTENSKSDIGWGHQIRSYVLHPYRLVKDNRTNYESSNPQKILDGELDEFLESFLYKK